MPAEASHATTRSILLASSHGHGMLYSARCLSTCMSQRNDAQIQRCPQYTYHHKANAVCCAEEACGHTGRALFHRDVAAGVRGCAQRRARFNKAVNARRASSLPAMQATSAWGLGSPAQQQGRSHFTYCLCQSTACSVAGAPHDKLTQWTQVLPRQCRGSRLQ